MTPIRKHREARNLTQYELGEVVGISKGWISQIENGKDNCPKWLAEKIASVLRCDVDTLFKTVVERKSRYIARKR